jgi:hypothetical protein
MRHMRPFWSRYRRRAQRVLAAKDALIAAGQVEIVTDWSRCAVRTTCSKRVVAANSERRDQPLLDALVRRSELCYDPDSFGLRADADACLINARGEPHADLWTMAGRCAACPSRLRPFARSASTRAIRGRPRARPAETTYEHPRSFMA